MKMSPASKSLLLNFQAWSRNIDCGRSLSSRLFNFGFCFCADALPVFLRQVRQMPSEGYCAVFSVSILPRFHSWKLRSKTRKKNIAFLPSPSSFPHALPSPIPGSKRFPVPLLQSHPQSPLSNPHRIQLPPGSQQDHKLAPFSEVDNLAGRGSGEERGREESEGGGTFGGRCFAVLRREQEAGAVRGFVHCRLPDVL